MVEPTIWVVVGAGAAFLLAIAVLLAVLLPRRGATLSTLEGRLSQMAQSQAAAQAQLSERLQTQERALARAVEERLAELGRRVGDSLTQTR